MEQKEKLIGLYLHISESKAIKNYLASIRQSNNNSPEFTDEEIMTIYIFGIIKKYSKVKDIYQYIKDHWKGWFPKLPSYPTFNTRLNSINGAFMIMINGLIEQGVSSLFFIRESVLDSMPIIVAGNRRSSVAKSAKDICDKGFCSSKNMYYYGVKLHLIGFVRPGTIPMPEYCGITCASENDLTVARPILEQIYNRKIYADKIYQDTDFNKQLQTNNNSVIITPVKKQKGQKFEDAANNLYSNAVSGIRQPVESIFNWLIEKTQIQNATKIRSSMGLLVHVWGKVAAAICLLIFNS